MKILLINNFLFQYGGVETCLFNSAKILRHHSHDVLFFGMDHPLNCESQFKKYFIQNKRPFEEISFISKISQSFNSIYSLEVKKKINKLIVEQKPDIVHLHDIQHFISPSVIDAISECKIPIIMNIHSPKLVCSQNLLLNGTKICERCAGQRFYRSILSGCFGKSLAKGTIAALEMYFHHKIMKAFDKVDLFISPSKFYIQKLQEMGFKGKIIFLPNPVLVENNYVQKKWDGKSIVYFGRLSVEKGLDFLLEAIKGLNVQLKIAGAGSQEAQLVKRAQAEKIDNIKFLGQLRGSALRQVIRQSLFSIQSSIFYENCPYSVLESFALGTAVIGARIGGIPELVIDGETGLTFNPKDSADLSKKIKYAINNPEEMLRMGKKAKQFIEAKFNPKSYYEQLMDCYSELLNS